MGTVPRAALLVLFPVVAAVIGSLVAVFAPPSARVTSAVQHVAAGVVFAALAGEVLPQLRQEGHLPVVVAAFAVGVALLLALGAYERRSEQRASRSSEGAADGASHVPLGLVVVVGIDLLIDGLLVGLSTTLGAKQGVIITVALTLEILFLALAVTAELSERGAGRRLAVGVTVGLGLVTAVGAVGGAAVLGGAGPATLAAVLAFGAAALLYLVTEELLVEAHEVPETPLLAGMFFVGFIAMFAFAA
ncbi:MAG: ZIP family metal transporter [Actinobacteria bacterium]|nr:ZIP family metal transporter [Actinomycetota bacterium]